MTPRSGMKITDESMVGERVRATVHYPERGTFCPAVTWTYEGVVARVRDVAADIRSSGIYPDHEAQRHEGEFHVTLRDVTVTSDPNTWLAAEKSSVTLIGHADIWELL